MNPSNSVSVYVCLTYPYFSINNELRNKLRQEDKVQNNNYKLPRQKIQ